MAVFIHSLLYNVILFFLSTCALGGVGFPHLSDVKMLVFHSLWTQCCVLTRGGLMNTLYVGTKVIYLLRDISGQEALASQY